MHEQTLGPEQRAKSADAVFEVLGDMGVRLTSNDLEEALKNIPGENAEAPNGPFGS